VVDRPSGSLQATGHVGLLDGDLLATPVAVDPDETHARPSESVASELESRTDEIGKELQRRRGLRSLQPRRDGRPRLAAWIDVRAVASGGAGNLDELYLPSCCTRGTRVAAGELD
jgi:hypothetical protein